MSRRSNVSHFPSSRRRRPVWRNKAGETLLGLGGLLVIGCVVGAVQGGFIDMGPDRIQGWLVGTDLVGPVTHIRDGDTIVVSGTPVRIANLDCDERGTSGGTSATARMGQIVSGQEVACRLTGRQSYDREIGHCALAGTGEDLGQILIREGVCDRWW